MERSLIQCSLLYYTILYKGVGWGWRGPLFNVVYSTIQGGGVGVERSLIQCSLLYYIRGWGGGGEVPCSL